MLLQKCLVCTCCFEDTYISQGSVATHLRCGGIFSDSIITDVFLIPTVKRFENWSIFDKVIRRTIECQFLGHPVYACVYAANSFHSFRLEEESIDPAIKQYM